MENYQLRNRRLLKNSHIIGLILVLLGLVLGCKHDEDLRPNFPAAGSEQQILATQALTVNRQANPLPMSYTIEVSNAAQFIAALKTVKPGDTILMTNDRGFDFSAYGTIEIPGNLTIYSWRNRQVPNNYRRYAGAYISTKNNNQHPLFQVKGPNVRFSGLRIIGADTLQNTERMQVMKAAGTFWTYPHSQGIESQYANLEVDNCELTGFSDSAIFLDGGTDAVIHDNYIHHNQRWGVGYGVCMAGGTALITENVFNYNRHAISGTGVPGEAYEASFNTIGPNSTAEGFDMHSDAALNPGENNSGDFVNIHHNTSYLMTYNSVIVAGEPIYGLNISNNSFVQPAVPKANPYGPAGIKLKMAVPNAAIVNNNYGIVGKYVYTGMKTY